MKINITKILIIILFIAVVAFGGIYYFGKMPVTVEKLVTPSSSGTDVAGMDLASAREIVGMINILRSIKLDTSFFEDRMFKGLSDYSQELPTESAGRANPFAPVGSDPIVATPSAEVVSEE